VKLQFCRFTRRSFRPDLKRIPAEVRGCFQRENELRRRARGCAVGDEAALQSLLHASHCRRRFARRHRLAPGLDAFPAKQGAGDSDERALEVCAAGAGAVSQM